MLNLSGAVPWVIILEVSTVVIGLGIVALILMAVLACIGAGHARRRRNEGLGRSFERARDSVFPLFPSSLD
jgi:hypothetical protein